METINFKIIQYSFKHSWMKKLPFFLFSWMPIKLKNIFGINQEIYTIVNDCFLDNIKFNNINNENQVEFEFFYKKYLEGYREDNKI